MLTPACIRLLARWTFRFFLMWFIADWLRLPGERAFDLDDEIQASISAVSGFRAPHPRKRGPATPRNSKAEKAFVNLSNPPPP
jgi:hypothetical protein